MQPKEDDCESVERRVRVELKEGAVEGDRVSRRLGHSDDDEEEDLEEEEKRMKRRSKKRRRRK